MEVEEYRSTTSIFATSGIYRVGMATRTLRFPALAIIACLVAATLAFAATCPPHDPAKQRCCNGALKPKNPDTRCCGRRLYRLFPGPYTGIRKVCCGGRVLVVDSFTTKCCGSSTFFFRWQKCCGGSRVISASSKC